MFIVPSLRLHLASVREPFLQLNEDGSPSDASASITSAAGNPKYPAVVFFLLTMAEARILENVVCFYQSEAVLSFSPS